MISDYIPRPSLFLSLMALLVAGFAGGCTADSSLQEARCGQGIEGERNVKCQGGFAIRFDAGEPDTCEPKSYRQFCEDNGMPCDPNFTAQGRCGERTVNCRRFINLSNSTEHCGECGNVCEGFPNAQPSCKNGRCMIGSCKEGFVDLDSDEPGCECQKTNGGEEACDGEDNDCDGKIDEAFDTLGDTCDSTEDGDADQCKGTIVCAKDNPDKATKCEPNEPTEEVCDKIDNDCDGKVDEGFDRTTLYRDADGDGYHDPNNSKVFCPGADTDGWIEKEQGKGDACDTPAQTADDTNGPPGLSWTQQACNACTDDDLDGYYTGCDTYTDTRPGPDCNDGSTKINPGRDEVCDGLDHNCDGNKFDVTRSCGEGVCSGTESCRPPGEFGECQFQTEPQPETGGGRCNNNKDDDCDGEVDERLGQSGDPTCDGIDDDCDQTVDEDAVKKDVCFPSTLSKQDRTKGLCDDVFPLDLECKQASYETCSDRVEAETAYQTIEVGCDGEDNDCDDATDENPTNARRLFAGGDVTCALSEDGTAYCWGDNERGQLGDGSADSPRTTPSKPVAGGHTFADLAVGTAHVCGIVVSNAGDDAGSVYCWGSDMDLAQNSSSQIGRLGLGSNVSSPVRTPKQVGFNGSPGPFVDVAAGRNHTCAITEGGDVYCWGSDERGQVGNGPNQSTRFYLEPTGVQEPSSSPHFETITAGRSHTCALDEEGDAYCWGDNRRGEVGIGSNDNRIVAPRALAPSNVEYKTIASTAGARFTCALRLDEDTGTSESNLYCWGADNQGQLGNGGGRSGSNTPAEVAGSRFYDEILAVGSQHACAVEREKRVPRRTTYCWGRGKQGRLGTGTSTNRVLVPVPIVEDRAYEGVAAGRAHGCGLIASSPPDVQCWGANNAGQLGRNSTGSAKPTPASYRCATTIR